MLNHDSSAPQAPSPVKMVKALAALARPCLIEIIRTSGVFILTLGVAPAFFDRATGDFVLPRPSALNARALAEKYRFRTTTVHVSMHSGWQRARPCVIGSLPQVNAPNPHPWPRQPNARTTLTHSSTSLHRRPVPAPSGWRALDDPAGHSMPIDATACGAVQHKRIFSYRLRCDL